METSAIRYKFMLRPIDQYSAPPDVVMYYDTKREEPDTQHGSIELSRDLTDAEMFRFDIYPAHYAPKDIKAVAARR